MIVFGGIFKGIATPDFVARLVINAFLIPIGCLVGSVLAMVVFRYLATHTLEMGSRTGRSLTLYGYGHGTGGVSTDTATVRVHCLLYYGPFKRDLPVPVAVNYVYG